MSEAEAPYSLEIVARLSGIDSTTILHYQEQGLLRPAPESTPEAPAFDDESLRTLRRLEHLRSTCDLNLSALRIFAGLLDEIDTLRAELKRRR
ncbi:MAG TPA: chaperone modulator CbpM [Verrucomicrobiales bacterium]|jgi:DNA-binding transcriptional MerR regulator|nr:chaperone modulator CbpM [Verrucomicrobiales bacterium]